MRSPARIVPTLALAAWVLGALPHAAFAAQEQEVVAVSALDQDVRLYIAKTGSEVMKHIGEAQKLTATTSDLAAAQRETGKALALLRSVEKASPTHRLHDAIAGLRHRTRTKKAKADDVIPVFGVADEVMQVEGVGVADVKTSLESAKGKLAKGSTVEAEADLIEADESVGYLEIDLPVQETEVRLSRALVALARGDKGTANAALAEALTHTKTWTAMAKGEAVEADVED